MAGYRGDVTVTLSTSNPVPPGGTVMVFFPKGFQLDTGTPEPGPPDPSRIPKPPESRIPEK